MLTITDFSDIHALVSKIDVGFIVKVSLEIFSYFVFLKLVRKIVEVFFSKIVSKISDHEIKRQYSTIKFLCVSILNVIIILFFATNILGDFGIDMKPILATAGVFGVAIGFGAKRFVEDVISGLQILLTGQIRVGDNITVGTTTGTVEKVNLILIKVRTFNGDVHYVRNSSVEKVINHTRDFSNPVVEIPVSYDDDIQKTLDVIKKVIAEISNSDEFKPHILDNAELLAIDSFDESSMMIKVRFKTAPMQQWAIKRRFRVMIKEEFDKNGISIPFNQLDVTIKNNV